MIHGWSFSITPERVSEVTQSCPTFCDPMDYSLPGSSVHGIFQARVLEWVAISFSRGYSQPRDWTQVSRIAGRRFTIWATRETITPSYPNHCGTLQHLLIRLSRPEPGPMGKASELQGTPAQHPSPTNLPLGPRVAPQQLYLDGFHTRSQVDMPLACPSYNYGGGGGGLVAKSCWTLATPWAV